MIDWGSVEEILNTQTSVKLKVRGVSMYPYLFTDDEVTIEPVLNSHNSYTSKDILFVNSSNRYLIHRYYSSHDDKMLTKGDNLKTPDFPADKVIGIVTRRKYTFKSLLKRFKYYILSAKLRKEQ